MKYETAKLKVPVVVKPQIETTAATPSPMTFGEHLQTLENVQEQLEMPAVTSRPGSSQLRLSSEKPQSQKLIPVLLPGTATDSMPIQNGTPVEPVRSYLCMKHL
jgi:hypothetical protein